MLTAITREISPALDHCELTYLPRARINLDLALQQHQQYRFALSQAGLEIQTIPADASLADSVFIEDTALVLDEVAVICRPGAKSRRAEVTAVKNVLKAYRILESIQAPGTLDGGDLLQVGKDIFAGLSTRSNPDGITQLQNIVSRHGYRVHTVNFTNCLHLKSTVTQIADGTLLVNPDWIDAHAFSHYKLLAVDWQEPHAANALLIGEKLIYPSSFPRTADKLDKHGISSTPVNVSELQKAEGAVSCCSLIFESSPRNSM